MKNELNRFFKLSLPLILAQAGVVLLGVADMVMLGNYDEISLKAAGLANVWVIGTLMFGIGCSLGVDPIISKLIGEGKLERAKAVLLSGKCLAIIVGLLTGLLWLFTGDILILFGQDELYASLAHDYALVQIPSLIPFFMYMVFRQYLIALEKTTPVAIVLILTNLINILLNWVFIYGLGPIEEMGLYGAGLSSCIMRAAQYILLCLIIFYSKKYQKYWVSYRLNFLDLAVMKRTCLMGVPIGLHLMLEAMGLQVTTFMAGAIGSDELGAHSIILNLQYLFFILPMSFSLCAATRVGYELGKKSNKILIVYKVSILFSCFSFFASTFILIFGGKFLIAKYGVSQDIINLSQQCLLYSGIFLFFYGVQLVGSGLLRGAGITMASSFSNVISLYICALPMCYYLGIYLKWGLPGIWAGLAFGMVIATLIMLSLNLNFLFKLKRN